MYAFLLVTIPATVFFFCTTNREFNATSFILPAVVGCLIASIFCFVKKFVLFSVHLHTVNLLENISWLLLTESLVPALILVIAFLLLYRDDPSYKGAALMPFLGAFYAVLIPFVVLGNEDRLSFFMLFAKPLWYAGSIALVATIIHAVGKKNIGLRIVVSLVSLLAFVFPSVAEALWYYLGNAIPLFALAIAWLIFALAVSLVQKK